MMLGSLTNVTTVSTTRISAAATVQPISRRVLPWIWAATRVLLGAELVQRVDERALDDHEHHRRDVQDDLVQRVDLVGVRRAARLGGDEVRQRARRARTSNTSRASDRAARQPRPRTGCARRRRAWRRRRRIARRRHSISRGGPARRPSPRGRGRRRRGGSAAPESLERPFGPSLAASLYSRPCERHGPFERRPGPSSRRGSPRPSCAGASSCPARRCWPAPACARCAVRRDPALPRAGRRRLHAEHVGLPGRLRDAERRPGGAGRAGAGRLPDRDRPRARARGAADASPAARRSPRRARSTASSGCWCGATGCGSPCRTPASPTSAGARRSAFPPAAARMYAVFDLGAVFYWAIPTAPPWWAAAPRAARRRPPARVRRMMIEYGEQFWGDRWAALYDVLGGNPLAAMPSLHFATSLMGAHLLSEVGPVAGAVGWTYALTARPGARLSGRALRGRPDRRGAAGREGPDAVLRALSRRPSAAAAPRGAATAARPVGARACGGELPMDSMAARAVGPTRAGPARPGRDARDRRRASRRESAHDGGDAAHAAHARAAHRHRSCSSPRRSRSCTSCCPSCSGCTRRGTASSTATAGGSPSPPCSRSARSSATSRCSAACSSAASPGSTGPRATRSRWPAWPPRGCSRRRARAASR